MDAHQREDMAGRDVAGANDGDHDLHAKLKDRCTSSASLLLNSSNQCRVINDLMMHDEE